MLVVGVKFGLVMISECVVVKMMFYIANFEFEFYVSYFGEVGDVDFCDIK